MPKPPDRRCLISISKSMKYYAVRNGRASGVYNTWSDCESQVKGYAGNQYKSFSSREAAEAYVKGGASSDKPPAGPVRGRVSGNRRASGTVPSHSSSSRYSGSYHPYVKALPSRHTKPLLPFAQVPPSPSTLSPLERVEVYTDGASKNNQARKQGLSKAGFGVYYGPNDSRNYSGRVTGEQTNSRGELEAIQHALQNSAREAKNGNSQLTVIHTDSQYSMDSIQTWAKRWEINGYKTSSGADVANQDLIRNCRKLVKEIESNSGSVQFVKVKGHSGNHGNDMADRLAVEGCTKE